MQTLASGRRRLLCALRRNFPQDTSDFLLPSLLHPRACCVSGSSFFATPVLTRSQQQDAGRLSSSVSVPLPPQVTRRSSCVRRKPIRSLPIASTGSRATHKQDIAQGAGIRATAPKQLPLSSLSITSVKRNADFPMWLPKEIRSTSEQLKKRGRGVRSVTGSTGLQLRSSLQYILSH